MGLLQNWIGELMRTKGTDLFRYKGILAVKGLAHKFVFQGVHMIFKHQLVQRKQRKKGRQHESQK